MDVMPKMYQDLVLDSVRQLLPLVEQALILFQDNRSGHPKISVAAGDEFEQLPFQDNAWRHLLGAAQQFCPFVMPGDAREDRWDVVATGFARAADHRFGFEP